MSNNQDDQEYVQEFVLSHLHDQEMIFVYRKLGYSESDIENVDMDAITKQAENGLKKLEPREKQFYINKKYQSLLLRRTKILKQIYEYYQKYNEKKETSNPNSEKKKKLQVVQKLTNEQAKFFTKERKFFEKIAQIKTKKYKLIKDIQQNSYQSSSHVTLCQKSASKNSIQSNKTSLSKSSNASKNLSKSRLEFIQQEQNRREEQRRKLYQQKMLRNRKKIKSVYENLKAKTITVRNRSGMAMDHAKFNLSMVKSREDIQLMNKKQRLKEQMEKFKIHREEQIKNKINHIEQNKTVYLKRESNVQNYQNKTIEERKRHMQFLDQKMQKIHINKKIVQETKKEEINRLKKQRESRKSEVIRFKMKAEQDTHRKNLQQFQEYLSSLKTTLQRKEQKQKDIKMKVLEERIKEEIANKNLQILKKQEELKKREIIEKRKEKKSSVQQFLKFKDTLISQRRMFLGKTLKKLQSIDKQHFSNKSPQNEKKSSSKQKKTFLTTLPKTYQSMTKE